MLQVKTFVVNMIEENCYVVSDSTGEAVIIDCGALSPKEREEISAYVSENALTVKHLLCTHAHFDHIFGVDFVYQTYGLCPLLHTDDVGLYQQAEWQTRSILHRDMDWHLPPVGQALHGGDCIRFGTHTLSVIETPGHTPGGVCFYCADEGFLFSGDSLFLSSIGRTDLPGGNAHQLIEGLRTRILTLPPETRVCPGHGPATTIGHERSSNPYLRQG